MFSLRYGSQELIHLRVDRVLARVIDGYLDKDDSTFRSHVPVSRTEAPHFRLCVRFSGPSERPGATDSRARHPWSSTGGNQSPAVLKIRRVFFFRRATASEMAEARQATTATIKTSVTSTADNTSSKTVLVGNCRFTEIRKVRYRCLCAEAREIDDESGRHLRLLCCKRRTSCLIGPSRKTLTWTFVLVIGIGSFITSYPALGIHPALAGLSGLLVCATLAALSATAFTDPGIVSKQTLETFQKEEQRLVEEGKDVAKLSRCTKCNVFREPYTYHCYSCNVCVLELDHHCPWYICDTLFHYSSA